MGEVLAALGENDCDDTRAFYLDGILKEAAIAYIETVSRRSFVGSEFELIADYNGCLGSFCLPLTPVVAVSSFQTRIDINAVWTDVDATKFEVIGDEIKSKLGCCCCEVSGCCTFRQYRVQWTTGATDSNCLPAGFKLAVVQLVQVWDNEEPRIPTSLKRLIDSFRTLRAY